MITNLLSVENVASILAVKRRFVYRLVAQGRIPFVRVGRYIRFRPEAIDSWMEARSTVPDGVPDESESQTPQRVD